MNRFFFTRVAEAIAQGFRRQFHRHRGDDPVDVLVLLFAPLGRWDDAGMLFVLLVFEVIDVDRPALFNKAAPHPPVGDLQAIGLQGDLFAEVDGQQLRLDLLDDGSVLVEDRLDAPLSVLVSKLRAIKATRESR